MLSIFFVAWAVQSGGKKRETKNEQENENRETPCSFSIFIAVLSLPLLFGATTIRPNSTENNEAWYIMHNDTTKGICPQKLTREFACRNSQGNLPAETHEGICLQKLTREFACRNSQGNLPACRNSRGNLPAETHEGICLKLGEMWWKPWSWCFCCRKLLVCSNLWRLRRLLCEWCQFFFWSKVEFCWKIPA